MLEGGAVEILAPFAVGMGGAGFTSAVPQPRNPDAEQEMRIRVRPGGTTHLELMKRFGFSVATLPWAELDGALRTGLVDGVVGGTPQLATESFNAEIASFTRAARQDVWPKIADEIGPEAMSRLEAHLGRE